MTNFLKSESAELLTHVNRQESGDIDLISAMRGSNLPNRLLDVIEQPVVVFDLRAVVIYWNSSAKRLFGWTSEETLGRLLIDFAPLAPNIRKLEEITRRLQHGETYSEEFPVRQKGGDSIRTRAVYVPIYEENKTLIGIAGLLNNTSEQELPEAALYDSERHYQTLFNSIDQGFCLCEVLFNAEDQPLDYRFLEVNPAFGRMTGIPVDKALSSKTARELVPNLEDKWVAIYGHIALIGEPIRFVEHSKAMCRWFDVYAFRIGGKESRKVAIFFSDITEEKRAERSLSESENKYRTLVEQASDGIHTYDNSGRFLEVNSKLCKMLGYEREELMQLNVKDLIPSDDLAANPIRFNELQAGKTLIRERRLLRKDGTLLTVEVSGRMIQDGVLQGIVRDITERKNTEEQLKQSEEWLRSIFESSHDGILVEHDEKIDYVNDSYARMFGFYSRQDLIGKPVSSIVSLEDAERVSEFGRSRLRGEKTPSKYEFKGRRKDGTLIDVEASVSASVVGNQTYITTVLRDITDRKRAETALINSENQLRLITDTIPLLVSFIDTEHRYCFVNRAYTEWFGQSQEEAVGKKLYDVLGDAAYRSLLPEIEKALSGEEVIFERAIPYKSGERFIRVNYVPEIDQVTGQVRGFHAFVQDISESKRAEEQLRRSHEELEIRVLQRTQELEEANEGRVKALQQLVSVQEDERQRIARDLHDQLGQQLTALRLRLSILKKMCGGNVGLQEKVDEAQEAARQLDSDVDSLAWQMRPTALDDLGLVAALDNYVRQWSTHFSIPAEFTANRFGKIPLTPAAETNFYYIAQEALNNIYKHAHASRVNILLEPRDDFAVLIIEDDGVGFVPEKQILDGNGEKRLGLIGMRERIALVGGTLEIESTKGDGTTIYARIPISN